MQMNEWYLAEKKEEKKETRIIRGDKVFPLIQQIISKVVGFKFTEMT